MPFDLIVPDSVMRVDAGRAAWKRIQDRDRMNREDWRLVGIALLEGRKLHPANKAFGAWCTENGFTLDPRDRSDAMWFAESHDEVLAVFGRSEDNLSHPTNIRKAYRKAKRAAETGAPTFTDDDATYALKLAAVAERGGSVFERDMAKEKLEAFAGTFGMTAEEVVGTGEAMQPGEVNPFDILAAAEAVMEQKKKVIEEVRERFKDATKDDLIVFIADLKARGLLVEE